MKRLIFIIASALLMLWLFGVSVGLANDEVGCYTASFEWYSEHGADMTVLEADEGVEHAMVGTFAWIRYDAVDDATEYDDSTYDNVVSYEIPPGTTEATICTTYWTATDYIQAADVESKPVVSNPAEPAEARAVVVTNVAGFEAWLTSNGLVVL